MSIVEPGPGPVRRFPLQVRAIAMTCTRLQYSAASHPNGWACDPPGADRVAAGGPTTPQTQDPVPATGASTGPVERGGGGI
ncbi:hypothetical protein GCM10023340_03660 [Nocardioides marinquilinus]|uniref:Uncharacterized protein n=1 Tax=Nocardioides marinquilinus TaxID=1210400 RepID=A0ABP9PBE9_9ACTN